jgi:hypothetical protein
MNFSFDIYIKCPPTFIFSDENSIFDIINYKYKNKKEFP